MTRRRILGLLILLAGISVPTLAAEATSTRYRIVGLCCVEREGDLREATKKLPGVELLDFDFADGEATFRYDTAKAFPGAKPEEIPHHLDNLLKTASHHTFGVKPLSVVPKEKLTRVEIAVVGLDCKACSLAAYEAIANLPGVEYATASFKEGRVLARIDPSKIDRDALGSALKARGVELVGSILK